MYKLDQTQLDYLARTIMPELYEHQAANDEFMRHLCSTLPILPLGKVPEEKKSALDINTAGNRRIA